MQSRLRQILDGSDGFRPPASDHQNLTIASRRKAEGWTVGALLYRAFDLQAAKSARPWYLTALELSY